MAVTRQCHRPWAGKFEYKIRVTSAVFEASWFYMGHVDSDFFLFAASSPGSGALSSFGMPDVLTSFFFFHICSLDLQGYNNVSSDCQYKHGAFLTLFCLYSICAASSYHVFLVFISSFIFFVAFNKGILLKYSIVVFHFSAFFSLSPMISMLPYFLFFFCFLFL